MIADHVPGAVVAPGFLVGEEGDDEITTGTQTLAQHVSDGGDDHRVHVLHVNGPATPEQLILDDTGEGVHAPILGCRRDHIGVAVDDESVGIWVCALDPCHQRGPSRFRFDDGGLQAHLVEPGGDEIRGRAFRIDLVAAPVLGVDADELLAQRSDLGFGGAEIVHGVSRRIGGNR